MNDFLGETAFRGDFVLLPERSTRDDAGFRFGIVSSARERAVVLTQDNTIKFCDPEHIVVIPPHCVPDDIESQLETLLGVV